MPKGTPSPFCLQCFRTCPTCEFSMRSIDDLILGISRLTFLIRRSQGKWLRPFVLPPASQRMVRTSFFKIRRSALSLRQFSVFRRPAGKDWNLRDLCNVFRDFKDLEQIFQNTPDGAAKIKQFTRTEKTRDNILQSVIRFTDKYSSIAAAWHHSNVEPVSLTQWAGEPGKETILVLGYNPDAEESLNQLNQAIFKRAVQLIAKRPNSDAARTWFILDEATQLGELPMISTLHRYCRAKGAAVVLATQSMAGLESVYDKSILEEINSNSGFKALLRTHGYQDARWAADQCGKYIQSRYAIGKNDSTSQTSSSSSSSGTGGSSVTSGTSFGSTDGKSISESLVDADNFKPESFMHDMMAPNERRGIDGVFFAELQSDEMNMPNQKAKGKKFWTGPIQSPQFKAIIMSKEQCEVPASLRLTTNCMSYRTGQLTRKKIFCRQRPKFNTNP